MGLFNTSNVATILLLSLSAMVMSFPAEAEQGGDLIAAVDKVEAFINNEVEKRVSDPAIFDSDKECMIMCKEVYQNTVDSLKTKINAPNFDVSAFTTSNIETCNDCFDSYQKFEEWAEGLRSDFLAKMVKYMHDLN